MNVYESARCSAQAVDGAWSCNLPASKTGGGNCYYHALERRANLPFAPKGTNPYTELRPLTEPAAERPTKRKKRAPNGEKAETCQAFWQGGKCDRPVPNNRANLCSAHYNQARRGNAFKPIRRSPTPSAKPVEEQTINWKAKYEQLASDHEVLDKTWKEDYERLNNKYLKVLAELQEQGKDNAVDLEAATDLISGVYSGWEPVVVSRKRTFQSKKKRS